MNGRIAPQGSAFDWRPAPSSPTVLSSTAIFIWRTWQSVKNNAFGLAMEAVVAPPLMLLVFVYLFGGAIAGSTGNYVQYLLPGFVVMTIVPMTVYSGTSLCQDMAKGVYGRFRTMPFWQQAAVLGTLATDGIRYAVGTAATFGAGLLMGYRPEGGAWGAAAGLLFIVLFAFSASWIFATIGVVAKRPETVSGSSMMLVYPLLFASNILVDTTTMPKWVGIAVDLNPVSVAVAAARGLMDGTAGAAEWASGLGVCALLIAVFAPFTFYLYRNKIK